MFNNIDIIHMDLHDEYYKDWRQTRLRQRHES